MIAEETSFIVLIATELTVLLGETLVGGVVHVHGKDPVSNAISLFIGYQVLFREGNLKWRWDVGFLKVSVIADPTVFWVFNGIIQIEVSVKEHECHVVGSFLSGTLSSI